MIFLVTGGAGFIGSHLCEALLERGHSIIALDNFDDYYDPAIKEKNVRNCLNYSDFHLVRGDILNPQQLEEVFSGQKPDMVIHLAARAGVRPSIMHPLLYQKVNIEGTVNVLETMKKHGVNKLILASSSSVYGNNEKIPYSETDNVDRAISPYAATKKACEVLAYTYYHLYNIETFCLRFFTVYGPRQRPEMAIHQFTRKIFSGLPVQLYGDGSTSRDYTYIEDIIHGILGCIDNLKGYEILNLGESKTITLINLVRLIEKELNKKAIIEWLPLQPGDVIRTYADIEKARQLIRYCPKTAIEDGIGRFVRWFTSSQK